MKSTKGMLAIMAAMMLFTAPAMADVKDRMVERRAIEAAVWGMPIVNFQASGSRSPLPAPRASSWTILLKKEAR